MIDCSLLISFIIGVLSGYIGNVLFSIVRKSKDFTLTVGEVTEKINLNDSITLPGFHLYNNSGKENVYVKILLFTPHAQNIFEPYKKLLYEELYTSGWTLPVNNEQVFKISFFQYSCEAWDLCKVEGTDYFSFMESLKNELIGYKLYILKRRKQSTKNLLHQDIKNYKLIKTGFLHVKLNS